MDLSDLKVGLREMNDAQLQELLLSIRQNRRMRKESTQTPRAAGVKKEKDLDMSAFLKTASKDQILEIIKALQGGQ